jgi:gas vesicle protein
MPNHDRGSSNVVGFVIGFVVGTVIGTALGVLLTPKSGADLRTDLRDAAERGAEAFRKVTGERNPESEA